MMRILNTALTKIIMSFVGLVILLINSNQLGASGVGTAGIITLTITIILMVNELVVGGALVYLIPRFLPLQILLPAYLWSILNALLFYFFLYFTSLIDPCFRNDVVRLALLLSLSNAHAIFLLGKQQVKEYNFVLLVQYLVQLVVLIFLYYGLHRITIQSYIFSLYAGYASAFLAGLYFVYPILRPISTQNIFAAIPQLFSLGFVAQMSNTTQLLNYRLSYYLIERFWGTFWLGRYVVSMQVSESVWIVSRSVALVQYADISNSSNRQQAIEHTLRYVKFLFLFALVGIVCVASIPSSVYHFLLGKDFSGIQQVVLMLSPGIIALAAAHPLSAFFSGTGKIRLNMYGSLLGFTVTCLAGFLLIPRWGLWGAALTQSLSYLTTFGFAIFMFLRMNQLKISDLFINTNDLTALKRLLKLMVSRLGRQ
ncbi:MAG: polysaccharide biosynthesis C-terminal domain-containing protein [Bacteroidales bacterium]